MCSRCLRGLDDRMIPTENTSLIGTEDDDDRSLIDLLNCTDCTESEKIPPIYRSSVTIKVNSYLANFVGFIPFGESFL